MTETTKSRTSQTIREQLEALDQRSHELTDRREQIDSEIDRLQPQLGKAMALDDAAAVEEAKQALRSAKDEREGAERGLAYLATEEKRLQAELHVARVAEAAADRDAKVAEAVAAVDALAESLRSYLDTFLPLAERATSLTQAANQAERDAAQRAGERLPSTGQARSEGWGRYPGLETVTAALRRYGSGSRTLNETG